MFKLGVNAPGSLLLLHTNESDGASPFDDLPTPSALLHCENLVGSICS